MWKNLCAPLLLSVLIAGYAGAQCVLATEADGYIVGQVTGVVSFEDETHGCLTDFIVDVRKSNIEFSNPTFRMLGGYCNDQPVLQDVTPGGRRTFSVAIDEFVYFAFCQDEDVFWVVDKGTVWSDAYDADSTGVANFVGDIVGSRLEIDELKVYRDFSLEVLRSPDPTTYYTGPMRRDTWFLQQVREKPAPTVRECVDALSLSD